MSKQSEVFSRAPEVMAIVKGIRRKRKKQEPKEKEFISKLQKGELPVLALESTWVNANGELLMMCDGACFRIGGENWQKMIRKAMRGDIANA